MAAMTCQFTIAICSYNNARMLHDTLQSIDNMHGVGKERVEVLVVDNNSTDETRSVCANYFPKSRIPFRYVFESKQGLSHARNRAIAEAPPGVIIFTDDDVLVPQGWLQGYIDAHRENAADSVYGPIYPEWGGERPAWYDKRFGASYALLDYGDAEFYAISLSQQFFGANFSCKTDLLREFGGFDSDLGRTAVSLAVGEETMLFEWLIARNRKIVYKPTLGVWHVIRQDRKTKSFLRKYFHDVARSIAIASLKTSRRKFIGVPLYQYKLLANFFAKFPLQYVVAHIMRNEKDKFYLALQLIRNSEMIRTYAREFVRQRKPRGAKAMKV